MPAVAPSGGSGDLIKVDPIALPASGATTGAEAATVAARGAAGGQKVSGVWPAGRHNPMGFRWRSMRLPARGLLSVRHFWLI